MASDCYQKTRLFPSQLLVSEHTPANINTRSTMIGVSNNKSWPSETNSKASGSSSGSSWSDLSSELGSTETGSDQGDKCDDDFIAQLTRQMADYMLEEEEEDDDVKGGRTSSCGANNLEVYKVEDQPSPKDTNYSSPGGRQAKWTELTQPVNPEIHTPSVVHYQRHVQQNKNNNKGKAWPSHEQQSRQKQKQQRFPVSGAGMKAVFLGENGTKSVSTGTGVFLPRGTGSFTEVTRKKRGCSTVLIPARVLQTLQVHFQDMNKRAQAKTSLQSDSVSNKSHQLQDDVVIMQSSELDGYKELHLHPNTASDDATSDNQDMDLPPEWIY